MEADWFALFCAEEVPVLGLRVPCFANSNSLFLKSMNLHKNGGNLQVSGRDRAVFGPGI
jgi:hypothetical protein